jgi:transcriptional regulator with XRE-family HTH domain
MNLRGLRESLGKTQDEIAQLAEITQSQLSKIERRDDHLISTLRRYVRALGGEIEVIAVVGEKRVALRGV